MVELAICSHCWPSPRARSRQLRAAALPNFQKGESEVMKKETWTVRWRSLRQLAVSCASNDVDKWLMLRDPEYKPLQYQECLKKTKTTFWQQVRRILVLSVTWIQQWFFLSMFKFLLRSELCWIFLFIICILLVARYSSLNIEKWECFVFEECIRSVLTTTYLCSGTCVK